MTTCVLGMALRSSKVVARRLRQRAACESGAKKLWAFRNEPYHRLTLSALATQSKLIQSEGPAFSHCATVAYNLVLGIPYMKVGALNFAR